ncbi:MAG: hypothetical protein WDW38_006612 [Sanguina aurantia]
MVGSDSPALSEDRVHTGMSVSHAVTCSTDGEEDDEDYEEVADDSEEGADDSQEGGSEDGGGDDESDRDVDQDAGVDCLQLLTFVLMVFAATTLFLQLT